ncbi:unnamed protein product [Schistosoma turkestanicum]|nr:unnamed protein product [Schistosoma turkestanicum]
MGAEQSVSQQKQSHDSARYSQLNSRQLTKGSGHTSSLPSSPQYDWRRSSLSAFVGTSYLDKTNDSNNYGSMRISSKQKHQQRNSISSLPKDTSASSSTSIEQGLNRSQRSYSTKSLNNSTFNKSSSIIKHKQTGSGILIVNPGRHTSSYYDLGGSRDDANNNNSNDVTVNHTELDRVLLKKLQRISTFEPLLTTMKVQYHSTTIANQSHTSTSQPVSSSSSSTSTSVKKKQFIPNLPEFNYEALVKMSSMYEQYLYKYTTELSQKQSDLVIIQNKIDRDISQLLGTLQAREKGINNNNNNNRHSTSSTFRSPFSSPKKTTTTTTTTTITTNTTTATNSTLDSTKLSGSQQIESVVLLTSQISGLITQCDELSKQLMNSINDLNEALSD